MPLWQNLPSGGPPRGSGPGWPVVQARPRPAPPVSGHVRKRPGPAVVRPRSGAAAQRSGPAAGPGDGALPESGRRPALGRAPLSEGRRPRRGLPLQGACPHRRNEHRTAGTIRRKGEPGSGARGRSAEPGSGKSRRRGECDGTWLKGPGGWPPGPELVGPEVLFPGPRRLSGVPRPCLRRVSPPRAPPDGRRTRHHSHRHRGPYLWEPPSPRALSMGRPRGTPARARGAGHPRAAGSP